MTRAYHTFRRGGANLWHQRFYLHPVDFCRKLRSIFCRSSYDYFATATGRYIVPRGSERDEIIHAIRSGQVFEPQVIDCARQFVKPGTCVLDVGANLGQMSIIFSGLAGPSGRVYSFEASELIFFALQLNLELNHCRNAVPVFGAVHECANQSFFYPKPDFSLFTSYGAFGIDPTASGGQSVSTLRIDDVTFHQPVSFMKVDIQGCDLFAMRGARQTIARNQMPILFEFEPQFQERFGTSWDDYERFIASIEYKIAKVIDERNFLIVPKQRA